MKKKKKISWKQEEKAEGWACVSMMKEGTSMPLYRNFWDNRLEESQQTIKWFHQPANGKNCIHISEMWIQLELKVRFCKLKCTQSQGSLHRILKIKDGIQCRETKQWWLTTYLLTLLSEQPVSEWTKMATSPEMPAVSSSGFLKLLTRFNKNQPTEIF